MPETSNPAVTMLELIGAIKDAIAHASREASSVKITKASLEIKAQLVEKAGGGIDLTPIKIPVKFGGEIKTTGIQTIHLDFDLVYRKTAGLKTPEALKESLVQAINIVKIAVRDAQQPVTDPNLPNLSFKQAEVTIEFILDDEGNIKFLFLDVSASVASQYANKIKLTLESA